MLKIGLLRCSMLAIERSSLSSMVAACTGRADEHETSIRGEQTQQREQCGEAPRQVQSNTIRAQC